MVSGFHVLLYRIDTNPMLAFVIMTLNIPSIDRISGKFGDFWMRIP
jgi:hypothetical protein